MIEYLKYLNVPEIVGLIIIAAFVIMQVVGEILEFKGKVVPEIFKVRKIFTRRKTEKAENAKMMQEVKQLLADVNSHYSEDNIAKRNSWMQWVDDRAVVYDNSIAQIGDNLAAVTQALNDNTKITEEIFVQNSRDRIIDFATKVSNEDVIVSREEFCRIFKVYDKYERFLEERDMTNGEVDIAYQVIKDSYEAHMKHHNFLEDVRGYIKSE